MWTEASSAAPSATTTRSASSSSAWKATGIGLTCTKHGINALGSYHNKIDDLVTVRARAGYAIDRALLYVTGGYAGAEDKISVPGYSSTDWHSGGVIGAGVEYAFTNNISAKAEYLYAPLGDKTYSNGVNSAKSDVNLSLVRAGLNYKF